MEIVKFQSDNAKALYHMLQTKNRVLLADETGMGKTYSTAMVVAMLALQKHMQTKQTRPKSKSPYRVLYICSNDRIARKNMGELCQELSRKDLIRTVMEWMPKGSKFTGRMGLITPRDAAKMASIRGARLSIPQAAYPKSTIWMYNATPDTSFRIGISAKVYGSQAEREALQKEALRREALRKEALWKGVLKKEALKKYKKCEKECSKCGQFNTCRKEAILAQIKENPFDLLILDEFQSYEDILSKAWGKECIVTVEDLLSQWPSKCLMLSATPYQTKIDDQDSLQDFRRVLSFLDPSGTCSSAFDSYKEQLLGEGSLLALQNAKEEFERGFQPVCRRNQRSDANMGNPVKAVQVVSALGYGEALRQERLTAGDLLHNHVPMDTSLEDQEGDYDEKGSVGTNLCQDTPWPCSFAKGYKMRACSQWSAAKTISNPFLKLRGTLACGDAGDCVECLSSFKKEETSEWGVKNNQLDCQRILCSAVPPAPWPNFKAEAVRAIALDTPALEIPRGEIPPLMNCIWLPPSAPEYEPERSSPYFPYYKKPASKTLVFCRYVMTTRALSGLLSMEAERAENAGFSLKEEEWQSLTRKRKPEDIPPEVELVSNVAANYKLLGHPWACAYRALDCLDFKEEEERAALAELAALQLVSYLRRPEIAAVLGRVLAKSNEEDQEERKDALLRYCANGNLTAVLREYWSLAKPVTPGNLDVFLECYQNIPSYRSMSQRQRFEAALRYFWNNRNQKGMNNSLNTIQEAQKTACAWDVMLHGCESQNWSALKKLAADWTECKPWVLPTGCDPDKGTYAGYVKAAYDERWEKIPTPLDASEITLEDLLEDQIRICADLLEKGETMLKYQSKWYSWPLTMPPQKLRCLPTKVKGSKSEYLWKNPVQILGDFGLFTYHTLSKLWNMVAETSFELFPRLPDSHICADVSLNDTDDPSCVRIPTRFACRYDKAVQDTKDNNENGAEAIAACFNSPFYPFVLCTTDVAKEGLSFDRYCARAIHLYLSQRPAVDIQRNGRIERFRSLVLRQRLASKAPVRNWEKAWKDAWPGEGNDAGGLIPNWCIPSERDDAPKLEVIYLPHPGTEEILKQKQLYEATQWYQMTLGSMLPDPLLERLRERYRAEGDEAIAQAVQQNLAPNLVD